MITCGDVMDFLQELAPAELAEDWDNIGLMTGGRKRKVGRILVCLDPTADALDKAAEIGADLLVTHHSLIFKGLKSVNDDDIVESRVYTAISKGISVISAHTNLDYADSGVNVQLASVLGLCDLEVLGHGPGRVGMLKERTDLETFISHVKTSLGISHVRVAGNAASGVRKVAVFGGSFDGDLDAVKRSCADVVVTGEMKHHTALDVREAGLCFIVASHFSTERVVVPYLASAISGRFPSVEVICFDQEKDPFITY
ncbi:MAG TPA: Nif3-like dinuclear metal center hexameric protein [Clostridiales bacterium]|nr:Nif3-like dinuclear metal center hexameric protein [Clostridiales bacterium]HOL92079.1 Nif3-like dinuclear metal center hexameric protein [Clostridiales bacterium]HPP35797.1 Nif3-like dinuclear metal center hexameric protein [Clostridiales bacterium]